MASLFDLFVSISGDNSRYKNAIRESISEGNKFGVATEALGAKTSASFERISTAASKLTGIGAALSASITLPLVGLGAAALKTAGQMEQNAVSFKTMMGSAEAAGKHLQALKDFALSTPFQFNDLVLASKRMQALGFESKDVVPMLRVVGDAAAGLGMGADGIQRIVTALGQMRSKVKVQAEEMRQLTEAGIPAWETLAKTLNTDVAGAMKMVEKRTVDASVAIPAILAGMNQKFGGLMAQQAKTLLGQWEQVKEKINFTLIDVGTALMPVAKLAMEKVIVPMLGLVKGLAAGFAELPGPVQAAAFAFTGFMGIVGPVLVIMGSLAGAVKSLRDTYLLLAGAQTAQVIPALVATRTATINAATSTVALGGTFTAFGTTATTATTAATAGVVSLKAALGGIVLVLAAIYEGYVAWKNIRETAKLDAKGGSSDEFVFTGFGGVVVPKPKAAAAAEETLPMPRGTSESRAFHRLLNPLKTGGGAAGDSIKDAFSALGLKDLQKELAEAVKAFGALSAAKKLTGDQALEAAGKIRKLRDEISGAREVAYDASGGRNATMGELWDLPLVVGLDKAPAYDRNRQLASDILGAMATDAALAARNVQILNDAYHGLGMQTPKELGESADAARQNYEIIRNSGVATAHDIDRAFVEYKLRQIELDHELGITDDELYASQKKNAEDALKKIGGEFGKATKEVNEFQRQIDRSFSRLARGIADSIINWKGFGATLKDIAKDTASSFLEIMIRQLIKPLEEQFAKLAGALGKALGLGGGAASGAANAAGGAASAGGGGGASAASAAGGGLAGTVTAVAGVVTAVSSVVGNFQQYGMNKSLDVLVNHSLRQFNVAAQTLDFLYTWNTQWFARTADMWNEIRNVVAAVREGGTGGGGKGGITFNNCSFTGSPDQIASAIFTQAQLAGAI